MNPFIFSIKNYLLDWKRQPLSALLLILIFSFLSFKAASISFTWDEAASYLYFVQYNTWKPYDTGILDANNHLMNTFFMILENTYLPKSVFFLRIHSVLSFLLFAGASFSICKGLVKKGSIFFLFTLLVLHPYFLDFFSLARGYAMSFALEMLALAILFSFISHARWYQPLLIILICCLATICNFSLLNFQLGVLGITYLYGLQLYVQKKWSLTTFRLALIPGLCFVAIFFGFLFPLLFKMKEIGNFYFGGSTSFWSDTVRSLAVSLSYDTPNIEWSQVLIKFVFISVFLAIPIWLLVNKKLSHQDTWRKLCAIYLILLLIIASTILQHYLLDTLFLIERTALLFLPIFLIALVVLLVGNKAKWIQGAFFILLFFHFINTFTSKRVLEWKMNSNNDKAFAILSKIPIPEGRIQLNLSSSFEYFSVLKFYCQYLGNTTIAPLHMSLNDIDSGGDYFIFPKQRQSKFILPEIIELYHDTISDFTIAKRKEPYRNKIVSAHYMVLNNTVTKYDANEIVRDTGWTMKPENMFSNGFQIELDSTKIQKNAFVGLDILVKINQPLAKEIGLAYNVERGSESLSYKYCELFTILNSQIGKWVHINYTYPLPQLLKKGDVISSFLYNNNNQHISYKQFNLSLFYYQNP